MQTNLNDDTAYISEFRKSLPIYQFRSEIISSVKSNNFLLITGETGSGKTTQLPQYLIESLILSDFSIWDNPEKPPSVAITQPRRVAAIQMAKRVSFEKNCKWGDTIGYTIRFEDKSSDNTIIKYVTDGILVKECLNDKYLTKYQIIVIDEAHERSLFSDIWFALVKRAVISRKGKLKWIIMSATLNVDQFTKYFDNCPLIKVSGKWYPVELSYQPARMEKRVETSVQWAIRIHWHEQPGHVLVFLTGFEECEQACKMTYNIWEDLGNKGKNINPMIIMALYGAQSTEDQARIFEQVPSNCRKLIYSTNISETSLTVDGIVYVIDCGYVKQKIYNTKTSIDSWMIVPISKVQAIQREGRAGRTSPGKCIRWYTEQFYRTQMPDVIIPEILRVNLSSTILSLKTMGIDNILNFEFMEKPNTASIVEAMKELYFIQAIDSNGKVTKLGEVIAKFPINCCYARALIASKFYNVENEMELLISLISSENWWVNVNKYDEERHADFEKTKNEFLDKYSDHMSVWNVIKEWEINNYSDSWCRAHFIHIRAIKQSRNIKKQIAEYVDKVNLKEIYPFYNMPWIDQLKREVNTNKELYDYEKINWFIRMSWYQGFYMNTARKMSNSNDGWNFIRISDGAALALDHFSAVAIKEMKPELLIYTELSGTLTKPVMKQVSVVDIGWIGDFKNWIKKLDLKRLVGKEIEEEKGEGFEDSGDDKEGLGLKELLWQREVKEKIKDWKNNAEEIRNKVNDAKERYLQRKREKEQSK